MSVWLKSEMFWMKDKLSVRNTNSGKVGWLDPDLCTEFLQNCGFVTVSRQNLFGISKGYSHNMGNTINLYVVLLIHHYERVAAAWATDFKFRPEAVTI